MSKKRRIKPRCQHPRRKHYSSYMCKKCYDRKRRVEAAIYQRLWVKTKRIEARKEALRRYGGKCLCCGEQRWQFLAFDHKYGGGSKHRKELRGGGVTIVAWIVKNNYPDSIQLLCHNCNQAKSFYGECPHKTEEPSGKESSLDVSGVSGDSIAASLPVNPTAPASQAPEVSEDLEDPMISA